MVRLIETIDLMGGNNNFIIVEIAKILEINRTTILRSIEKLKSEKRISRN